jgi:ABC-type lipoprotein export system ATPase subunit
MSQNGDPVAIAEHVTFAYPANRRPTLSDVSLRVERGAMVAVTGPSGVGKSTLIYLLGLFIRPTEGEIVLLGSPTRRLSDASRSRLRATALGLVFQDPVLHPELSIEENVAEGALYAGCSYREAIDRARRLLDRFGIGDLRRRRPGEVSGGQAQRAVLCRALIREPVLILADEPTGSLDAANGTAVLAGLRAAADRGAGVLIATHSQAVAEACDATVRLA